MPTDDTFLIFYGERASIVQLKSNINSCLDRFKHWTSMNSLKTKAILFGPTYRVYDNNSDWGAKKFYLRLN